jgi:hypothetical protein
MPTFPDLRDFYDPALVLPVDGVEYRIEPPSINDGLRLRRLMLDPEVSAARSDIDYLKAAFALIGAEHDAERDLFIGAEGSVFTRLEAAGTPWPTLLKVAETAALHWSFGELHSQGFWSREALIQTTAAPAAPASESAKPQKRKRK